MVIKCMSASLPRVKHGTATRDVLFPSVPSPPPPAVVVYLSERPCGLFCAIPTVPRVFLSLMSLFLTLFLPFLYLYRQFYVFFVVFIWSQC